MVHFIPWLYCPKWSTTPLQQCTNIHFLYELLERSTLKFDQSCNGNVGLPAIHMWTFSRRKRIGHATCVHIAYCYWRPFLLYILSPTYFSHNQETRDDNLTQGQHCFSGHICISDTPQCTAVVFFGVNYCSKELSIKFVCMQHSV